MNSTTRRGVNGMERPNPPKTPQPPPPTSDVPALGSRLKLTREQWKARLTKEQYTIMREKGTELAWSGTYLTLRSDGMYHCAACNAPLFSAKSQYDSRSGWPSFTGPVDKGRVLLIKDERYDLKRLEILCAHCGAHLGHIFDDGPSPHKQRFCVNSTSLFYRPEKAKEKRSEDPSTSPRP